MRALPIQFNGGTFVTTPRRMRLPRAVVDWRTVRAAMLDVMNILPELSQSCRPTDDEEEYSTESVRVAPRSPLVGIFEFLTSARSPWMVSLQVQDRS